MRKRFLPSPARVLTPAAAALAVMLILAAALGGTANGAAAGAAVGTPEPPRRGTAARPYTANVALFPAAFDGDEANNYNNTTVIWSGPVSPAGKHVQTRLLGRGDGVMVYIQVIRSRADGTVVLQINGRTFAATYGSSPSWEWGARCEGPDACRGWTAWRLIPWAALGGMPQVGDVWPLRQEAFGYRWSGVLHWGLPDYGGENVRTPLADWTAAEAAGEAAAREMAAEVAGEIAAEEMAAGAGAVQLLTLPLTADAPVGGNTNCGSDDWPDYFPTWGRRNTDAEVASVTPEPLGSITQASTGQNQTDVADWPCYNKYYARFALDALPPGAQVLAASVEVQHFGNSGYGAGYDPDGAQDTVLQIYEVDAWWEEMEITWDNAPRPRENIGRMTIVPIDVTCPDLDRCSVPYFFDITEIVRRAQAAGRAWASFATYTGSGDYHSGKYIWTREGADQAPVVRIWYAVRQAGGERE